MHDGTNKKEETNNSPSVQRLGHKQRNPASHLAVLTKKGGLIARHASAGRPATRTCYWPRQTG